MRLQNCRFPLLPGASLWRTGLQSAVLAAGVTLAGIGVAGPAFADEPAAQAASTGTELDAELAKFVGRAPEHLLAADTTFAEEIRRANAGKPVSGAYGSLDAALKKRDARKSYSDGQLLDLHIIRRL